MHLMMDPPVWNMRRGSEKCSCVGWSFVVLSTTHQVSTNI